MEKYLKLSCFAQITGLPGIITATFKLTEDKLSQKINRNSRNCQCQLSSWSSHFPFTKFFRFTTFLLLVIDFNWSLFFFAIVCLPLARISFPRPSNSEAFRISLFSWQTHSAAVDTQHGSWTTTRRDSIWELQVSGCFVAAFFVSFETSRAGFLVSKIDVKIHKALLSQVSVILYSLAFNFSCTTSFFSREISGSGGLALSSMAYLLLAWSPMMSVDFSRLVTSCRITAGVSSTHRAVSMGTNEYSRES